MEILTSRCRLSITRAAFTSISNPTISKPKYSASRRLGARRIEKIKTWVVMEAPTGQRFCVINRGHKYFDETANRWE